MLIATQSHLEGNRNPSRRILQEGQLSPLMASIKILDSSEKNLAIYWDCFYTSLKNQSNRKLGKLLDAIYEDPCGHSQLFLRMDPHIITQVMQKFFDEMDGIKDNLWMRVSSHGIMPNFLKKWGITLTIGGVIAECVPILNSAVQTEWVNRENTTKDCTTVGIISIYLFHSYAWLSGKALLNSCHTACKTAVKLQSLLCYPLYPLFMDKWCIKTDHWIPHMRQ